MADLVVTAANVVPQSNAIVDKRYTAGATITAGQTVYLDPADNLWKLADANLSVTASGGGANGVGIALHAATAGQPIAVIVGGDVAMGSILTAGVIYIVSATAGGIAPSADSVSGWFTTILGVAISATVLRVALNATGISR